ncbi:hypothetical protein RZS08_05430, partial [Arthrospira platensis SPKY1]|nr:hypothetical protein [Arthrospira platensis SPKY1]
MAAVAGGLLEHLAAAGDRLDIAGGPGLGRRQALDVGDDRRDLVVAELLRSAAEAIDRVPQAVGQRRVLPVPLVGPG